MDYKDYYKILGIERNADEKEIKKAYRKLARQYHPDVNQNDKTAENRFKEINEAYEVLSDPDKREKYNRFGADWQRYQQSGAAGGFDWANWARANGGGGQRFDYEQGFGGANGDFSDFFSMLFGQGFGGAQTGQRTARARRGQDIEYEVTVSLLEAYQGTTRILKRDGQEREIKIPAGVKTGSKVRLSGQGEAGMNAASGDLYLIIEVAPDPRFERDGDDLTTDFELPLYTAMLGGKAGVPTLSGTIQLTIPAETQNGRRFRLKGKGMPKLKNPTEYGDLYATAKVVLPSNLKQEEKELFQKLQELR